MKNLHGGGTGVVTVVEPTLDARAVVGNAGGEVDREFHDVERYGATEEAESGKRGRGHCQGERRRRRRKKNGKHVRVEEREP